MRAGLSSVFRQVPQRSGRVKNRIRFQRSRWGSSTKRPRPAPSADPQPDGQGEEQEHDRGGNEKMTLPERPGSGDDAAAAAADGPVRADRSAAGGAAQGGGFIHAPSLKVAPQFPMDIENGRAVRIRAAAPGRHVVGPDELLPAFGTMDLQHRRLRVRPERTRGPAGL